MPNAARPRDHWFLLPVLFAMLLDGSVTLAMQPAGYWRDHALLREANPAWAALLRQGPAVYCLAFGIYCLLIAGTLRWVTGALQKLLGMFVLLAHTYGAASWANVANSDRAFWAAFLAVLLGEALVFALYWRLSPWGGRRSDE